MSRMKRQIVAILSGFICFSMLTSCTSCFDARLREPAIKHMWQGVDFAEKGNNMRALTEFQKSIIFNPYHVPAHYNLGLLYNEHQQYDNAISRFNRVLFISPSSFEAYFGLGVAYCSKGERGQATKNYQILNDMQHPFAPRLAKYIADHCPW
jgi:tetratricopeptide (TPR) repeat protein